jgi:hypothetical protein
MARELSDAIAAAVAEDPRVEACRERARAAGFEMKLSLEAIIGFVNRRPRAPPNDALSRSARTINDSFVRFASLPTRRRRRKSNRKKKEEDKRR